MNNSKEASQPQAGSHHSKDHGEGQRQVLVNIKLTAPQPLDPRFTHLICSSQMIWDTTRRLGHRSVDPYLNYGDDDHLVT